MLDKIFEFGIFFIACFLANFVFWMMMQSLEMHCSPFKILSNKEKNRRYHLCSLVFQRGQELFALGKSEDEVIQMIRQTKFPFLIESSPKLHTKDRERIRFVKELINDDGDLQYLKRYILRSDWDETVYDEMVKMYNQNHDNASVILAFAKLFPDKDDVFINKLMDASRWILSDDYWVIWPQADIKKSITYRELYLLTALEQLGLSPKGGALALVNALKKYGDCNNFRTISSSTNLSKLKCDRSVLARVQEDLEKKLKKNQR